MPIKIPAAPCHATFSLISNIPEMATTIKLPPVVIGKTISPGAPRSSAKAVKGVPAELQGPMVAAIRNPPREQEATKIVPRDELVVEGV